MEWCQFYANLPDHPRVQAAEADAGAGWLIVQSIAYCTRAESCAFIPHTQIPMFGGQRLRQRVAALIHHGIYLPVPGGYELDPEIWNEERNLSDRAERKRKADRERIKAKRAAAKATQNGQGSGDMSRDMSRDSSGDSRPPEESRKDKPPPAPPVRPLFPSAVAEPQPGEGDQAAQDQDPDLDALVAEVHATRGDWAPASIQRALSHADVLARADSLGWARVRFAMLAVAADPLSGQPGRLSHDGPWWQQATGPPPVPRPPHCGGCDPETRQIGTDPGQVRRCPNCHPLAPREVTA